MLYKELAQIYEKLGKTPKRLEKTRIISEFLKEVPEEELKEVIYLLQGKVFPGYDERKIGFSSMLTVKLLSQITGVSNIQASWRKKGDLGLVAEQIIKEKKQSTLASKELTIKKVFQNLRKLAETEGKGTVNRKLQLISELISNSTPLEAKFITRTILDELRVGTAAGTLRDSLVWAFFPKILGINTEEKTKPILKISSINQLKNLEKYKTIEAENYKLAREIFNYFIDTTQNAYDISNNFGKVALQLKKGISSLKEITLKPGLPINSMLAIKEESIEKALKDLGKPLMADYKLDGFRVQIHRNKDKVWLFTRGLENVTNQFKELIPIIKKHIRGDSYIIDSEVIGYDPITKKYLPFQAISQRIKRKYHIEKKAKELPVEINIFDIIYYNKPLIDKTLEERRRKIESIIKQEKGKIILTEKRITSDMNKIKKFYKKALNLGHEGLMLKNLNKPYIPGRKAHGWLKLKPELESLDLVIVKATYGEGKRAKLLSSFTLACKHEKKLLECGMMGTGIKEKTEGVTFKEMTKLLKPHIKETKNRIMILEPKIIVEVLYEEIQKSPTYNSGYALRFPRLIRLRPDKSLKNISSLKTLKEIYKNQKKLRVN